MLPPVPLMIIYAFGVILAKGVIHMNGTFFSPDGNEIRQCEFIKTYGNAYFLDVPRVLPRVAQSSRWIEEQIEHILTNGITCEADVMHLMAWKIGKVKHRQSQKTTSWVYSADWENAESGEVRRYGNPFKLMSFAEYIVREYDWLCEQSQTNAIGVLEKLEYNAPKGIGSVYLLTLLYAVSKKRWPIYDKFAAKALEAINSGKKPCDVTYHELPDRAQGMDKVFEEYRTYVDLLERYFPDHAQCRDIDRALWVYGHMKGICKEETT